MTNRRGKSRRQEPKVRRAKAEKHAIEVTYRGQPLRSLLEQRLAVQLDERAIRWAYEPERISGANYLVDFYLPDLHTWIEVKGYFDSREDLLLPFVARALHRERNERLFLYMAREYYRVGPREYERLDEAAFWDALTQPPEDAGQPPLGDRRPPDRRPWIPRADRD